MASPEQYRRYAADCLTVAQQIGNPADRATLLLKAEIWLSLAEQAERAATGCPPAAAADNRGDDRSA
jgi:hypothetical protein